jgi:hypothetical protein
MISIIHIHALSTGAVSGSTPQSGIPGDIAFFLWLVLSLGVFLSAVWWLFSSMDGAFLHLPRGRWKPEPPPNRRCTRCGHEPDDEDESCSTCGQKLASRIMPHLQRYRGIARKRTPRRNP